MNLYRILTATFGLLALMAIAGCSPAAEGTLIGGAGGAGAGALVGSAVGAPGTGAVVGGLGGAVLGYAIGHEYEEQQYRRNYGDYPYGGYRAYPYNGW